MCGMVGKLKSACGFIIMFVLARINYIVSISILNPQRTEVLEARKGVVDEVDRYLLIQK
jgi:hypothetical protein